MLHQLQKQWCIWPTHLGYSCTLASQARKWDRVIGLVPQQLCLFKQFQYQVELIEQRDIAGCVKNELEQLGALQDYDCYHIIQKANDTWLVSVWFWDPKNIAFEQDVTHVVPSMAYDIGRLPNDGVLIYSEDSLKDDHTEMLWSVKLSSGKFIEELFTLNSQIHRASMRQKLQAPNLNVYHNRDNTLTDSIDCKPLNEFASSYALTPGKRTTQFDIDNPWKNWKAIAIVIVAALFYALLDYGLLTFRKNQVDEAMYILTSDTQDLVRKRAVYQDKYKYIEHVTLEKIHQQIPAKLFDVLSDELPSDVLITQFLLKKNILLLEGTVIDTNVMLNRLNEQKLFKNVELLGEVIPDEMGRQQFRVEIELLEVEL